MSLTDVLLMLCFAALCAATIAIVRKPRRSSGAQSMGKDVADETRRLPSLTPREWQVCQLAAQGKSNKQIAAELGLSVNTVQNYLKSAYKKLGVSSRAALANRLRDGPN